MLNDYYQVRDWLESFIPQVWTKQELGLERIKYLLKLLGNPQDKFKSIHIAGTSGKGSTAFYIAQLLCNCKLQTPNSKLQTKLQTNSNSKKGNSKNIWDLEFGHWKFKPKVGLHLSPHLVDIRERMQVFRSGKWKGESGKSDEKLMTMSRFIELFNEIYPVVEKIKKTKADLTPSY